MSRAQRKSKLPTNSFAGIPRVVMDTEDYKGLSGNAVKLLLRLAYQYRGKNNGDLTAAWSIMRNYGFNSKATLTRCIKELIGARMLIKTREGKFINPGGVCNLYGLTWQPIDECPGKRLDYSPTRTPPRKFSLEKNT